MSLLWVALCPSTGRKFYSITNKKKRGGELGLSLRDNAYLSTAGTLTTQIMVGTLFLYTNILAPC